MNLVCVHGFLGSSLNWGPVMNRLKAIFGDALTITAVDLLGHGRRAGEPVPRPLTLEAVTDDLEKQLPPGPFVGLGHSFGLRPLLLFAERYPERVPALIIEDSSPVLSDAGFAQLRQIFDEIRLPVGTREEAKVEVEKLFGPGTPMSRFLLSNVRETADGQQDWRFAKEALRELLNEAHVQNLWREWESFAGPLYMILGENSKHVGPVVAKECISRRRGKPTEEVWISGAGHWVHADQLEVFVREVSTILRRLTI